MLNTASNVFRTADIKIKKKHAQIQALNVPNVEILATNPTFSRAHTWGFKPANMEIGMHKVNQLPMGLGSHRSSPEITTPVMTRNIEYNNNYKQ